jgi:hypothetical protein
MSVSHTAAFRAQSDFAPEAKIKVGKSVWSDGVAGARLYEQVLSKYPGTIQKVLDMAAELKPPFTAKAVQGHLRWMFTGGQLEVDGTSFPVAPKVAKAPKPAKAEAPKVEPPKDEAKPEPKAEAKAKFKPRKKLSRAA